jgi:di/tripeptidase
MLKYNAASLDNRFPTFRDNTMSPSSGVEVRSLEMRPLRSLKTSGTDYPEKRNSQLQICKNYETRISDMYRVSKSIRKTPCI